MSEVTEMEHASLTHAGDDNIEELATDTRQFVTFFAGEEVFAVDMAPVQEIIRLPDVVRVPLAPMALDGLANLRGKILPIISLRRMFGFEEREADEASRAVVVDVGQPLGFVVDRVASVVSVEPSQIEGVEAISSTVDTDLLSGLIKEVGGHAMIMVINFEKLIEREFAQIAHSASATSAMLEASVGEASGEDRNIDELQLVSFNVAAQEYAANIENVQEIVQVPDEIIHVPHSDGHIVGVMTLRSRLLPLVSLRAMFGLADRDMDEKSRIVVLALGTTSVGIVVDGVNEVLRVAKTFLEPVPAALTKDNGLAEISGICRIDDGKRLVSIIAVEELFSNSAIREAMSNISTEEIEVSDEQVEEHLDDDEQVVIFRLGKEEFGVPINSVQEIVRVPDDLVRIPTAPSFVKGIINLRGSVLPVIDLRLRLGLGSIERTDGQRIMVFMINDVRTGFIVDQVAEVLKIARNNIEPAPQLSQDQIGLLSRIANIAKQARMVQLLDPQYLVEGEEMDSLIEIVA
jgi:purine-binding chemotaxis protein CheW